MKLINRLECKKSDDNLCLFPIDSKVIKLTSKLSLEKNYEQVKLINGINAPIQG
jgi:hypothetical protein